MFHTLSPIAGTLLMALILLDVFMTVLYTRVGTGVISHYLSCLIWRVFRVISAPLGRWRDQVLAFCGPVMLVTIVAVWMVGLACGAALIIWPALGTSIRATNGGATPNDFATPLYVAADSMSTVGTSDLAPQTSAMRLFSGFNSFIGICFLTLTLTYLLEIYNALQHRNTFALKLHTLSAETGDAAEMIALLGPDGRFDIGYQHLVDVASEMIAVKEAHHFYSALFFFRFREPHYAVSRMALVTLDAISLIKSGLDDEEYGWLKKSAAVEQLWRGSMQLLTVLAAAFLPETLPHPKVQPFTSPVEQWEERYRAAIAKMEQAKVKTFDNPEEGAQIYIALRTKWDPYIGRLAEHMALDLRNIDRAMLQLGRDPALEQRSLVPSLHTAG